MIDRNQVANKDFIHDTGAVLYCRVDGVLISPS